MHHRQEWVEIRLYLPPITLATLILELNFKTTKIRILSHDFKVLLFSFMCLVYFTFKDIIIKNLKNISKSRPPPSHPSPPQWPPPPKSTTFFDAAPYCKAISKQYFYFHFNVKNYVCLFLWRYDGIFEFLWISSLINIIEIPSLYIYTYMLTYQTLYLWYSNSFSLQF